MFFKNDKAKHIFEEDNMIKKEGLHIWLRNVLPEAEWPVKYREIT